MRFFDRTTEINHLKEIREQSNNSSRFTVITGRRRIGKTTLVLNAYKEEEIIYLFVSRGSESELCREFIEEIKRKLDVNILGNVERFVDLFDFLMQESKKRPITLMIDEFQNFKRVNSAIFSQMQKVWDLNKETSKLNLIVCGSVFSLMNQLFKNSKEALYGRQTDFIRVMPFNVSVLKEILSIYNTNYTNEDLLALYMFSGGVAKYVEILMDNGCTTKDKMINKIFSKDSYFLSEGKNMLIEEFGRDYGRYFEILTLIASGHNTRSQIEDILKSEVAGYLTRLENDYALISKIRPMFETSVNKNTHYLIEDNFLNFWFRFMYKYNYMLEIEAYDKLKMVFKRDYNTYSGKVLEKYFKALLQQSNVYTRLGSWWDRKSENEIDIIAEDELSQSATFFEVKRKKEEIDLNILKHKSEHFLTKTGRFKDYTLTYKGLSMEDM